MALFAKKTRTPTQDDIARLHARRDALASQLESAEAAAQVKQRAVERLLIDDGEPALLQKAQDALADTERQARSLVGAISALDSEVAAKQEELAVAADKKQRLATIAQLDAHAAQVAEAAAAFIDGARRFAEATGNVAGTIWEINRMRDMATALVSDVETAGAIAESLIRDHAAAVANGSAPATLRMPEVAPPPVATPQKPTRAVYTIKPVIWTDPESGFQQTRPSHAQARLDVELAARAIAIGAAWDVADPRVVEASRTFPPRHAAPSVCTSLDPVGGDHQVEQSEPRIDDVIRHSAFEQA